MGLMTPQKFVIAICALSSVAGCAREAEQPAPIDSAIQLSEQFTGVFTLVNKRGQTVTNDDFEGKIMLVYFGFTHCPDVCPNDVGVISAALNALGSQADSVAPIFITVDPERDTPDVLASYFAFDERIIPLTGTVEAAAAARAAYKLYAQKAPFGDGQEGYDVQHGRFFYINDRTGQPQFALTGGGGPQELKELLQRSIEQF